MPELPGLGSSRISAVTIAIDDTVFSDQEQLVRILGEAPEPLFPSEITARLNQSLGGRTPYTITEVVMFLKRLADQIEQTSDGRWALKRRMS